MFLHPGSLGGAVRSPGVAMQRRKGKAQVVRPGTKMAESDLLGSGPRKKQTERDCSVLQGEAVKEKTHGTLPPQNKQEIGEGPPSQQEIRWQEKDRNPALSPYSVWRPSRLFEPLSKEDMKEFKASYRAMKDTTQLPQGGYGRSTGTSLDLSGKMQAPYERSESSRKLKEQILAEQDAESLEIKRQHFRHFCYQEIEGPRAVLSELQELCHQWLVPERHTKEQIVDLVILEQFLTILPLEMQIWVCKSGPATCAQALALAESFLLRLQESENCEQKGSGLLEETYTHSPPSEQDPSDTIESCISTEAEEGEEEAALLEHSKQVQDKAEKAAFLLGISEPMEWGLPPERTRLFQGPEGEGVFGNLQQNYPGKGGKQAPCLVEGGNSVHRRNFPEGGFGQKKKAKASAENGLPQSFGFLKSRKVQTVDKPSRCAPCGERFHKRPCREQPGKLPQRGDELPKCLAAVRRDEGAPESQAVTCRCKAKKGGEQGGHFLPLSADGWKTPKGEKLSKGEACGERVSWGAAFPAHDKADHGGKPHQCFECGKRFSQKGNLNIHKKTHTGEKPYPCSECGKCFVTNSRLLTHKRVHTGEKPYNCSYCGNNFSQLAHLVQHQRRHTGEKPYSCPYCGKSFSVKANLITHQRTHTGEKPYECSECPKSFVSSSDLKKHKRVHMGQLYTCGEGVKSTEAPVPREDMTTIQGEVSKRSHLPVLPAPSPLVEDSGVRLREGALQRLPAGSGKGRDAFLLLMPKDGPSYFDPGLKLGRKMEGQAPVTHQLEEGSEAGGVDSHRVHAGADGEFLTEEGLVQVKEEPDGGPQQHWESQWQDYLKKVELGHQRMRGSQRPQLWPTAREEESKGFQASPKRVGGAAPCSRGEDVAHSPMDVGQETLGNLDRSMKEESLGAEGADSEGEQEDFNRICCPKAIQSSEILGSPDHVIVKSPKSEEEEEEENSLDIVKVQLPMEVKEESDWEADSLVLECGVQGLKNEEEETIQLEKPKKMCICQTHSGSLHVPERQVGKRATDPFIFEEGGHSGGETILQCREKTSPNIGQQWHHAVGLPENHQSQMKEKLHKYTRCGKISSCRMSLIPHERSHAGGKAYICSECGKSFGWRTNLVKHKRIHTGEKPYKCSSCGKNFNAKSTLIKHERSHTGEKPFECTECGKAFGEKGILVKHLRIHTGEKPHKCSVCGKSFIERGALIKHERTHTGEKPYECSDCGKTFRISCHLKLHKRTHTGEKPHRCLDCGRSFSERASLVKHERTHTGEKPYECSECGKSFRISFQLVIHKRTHTGEKPHECSDCGNSFREIASLIKHKRTHTGEKPYECSECGKSFRTSFQLKTHRRTHTGEKPYQCLDCGQNFSQRSRLVIHERTHTGERPYGCSECGKSFVSSSHLRKHSVVHTGEKPHRCSYCEKSFSKKSNLVVHERIHTGEKPYECSVCKKRFCSSSVFHRHMKIHPGEKS
ncbi:uncharacterized protein LOC110071604 [Pogona vitticeps]